MSLVDQRAIPPNWLRCLIDCLSVNVVSRLESHTTILVVIFDRLFQCKCG